MLRSIGYSPAARALLKISVLADCKKVLQTVIESAIRSILIPPAPQRRFRLGAQNWIMNGFRFLKPYQSIEPAPCREKLMHIGRIADDSAPINITRSALLSLAIAVTIIVPMDGHQVNAEEAATSPTCTGCSGSKIKGSRDVKPKAGRNERRSSARLSGGRVNSFDGTWAGLSTGHCIPNYNWTINVNNGVVSGANTSGSVSRGGIVKASMMVNGYRYDVVGRAGGSSASGTWVTTGNCAGRWTATKS